MPHVPAEFDGRSAAVASLAATEADSVLHGIPPVTCEPLQSTAVVAERLARQGTWVWRPACDEMEWSEGLLRVLDLRVGDSNPSYEGFIGALHPEDRPAFLLLLEACLQKGDAFVFEHRVMLADEGTRQVRSAVTALTDATGTAQVVGVMQDITELATARSAKEEAQYRAEATAHKLVQCVHREKELLRSNSELELAIENVRANQARVVQAEKLSALGKLTADVAHELNNPMMGVMNYVDYALRTVRDSHAKHVLYRAARELERMRDLLQSMLACARPIDEPVREVDIRTLVTRTLALLQPDLKAKGIGVRTYLEPRIPPVSAKEGHLQQVLINLLMNARDALAECVEKSIRIRAWRCRTSAFVEVKDTGRGISAAIQNQIFDPFFTTKPPGSGIGLGLSVARNIMLDMQGDLSFCSEPGQGAAFTMHIPLANAGETF